MTVTIYHNPRCSKSRQTLDLLQDKGVELEIVEYLETPPSADELKRIVGLLGIGVGDIVRAKEAAEEGVDMALDDEALIAGISAHPRILQRPIVVNGDRAVIGRPPENVFDIL